MVTPKAWVHTVVGFQGIDQGFRTQALWVEGAIDVGKCPRHNCNHGAYTRQARDQARRAQGGTGR